MRVGVPETGEGRSWRTRNGVGSEGAEAREAAARGGFAGTGGPQCAADDGERGLGGRADREREGAERRATQSEKV